MHITVCICTRNRGLSIVATIESIISSTHLEYDVVIVDQSDLNDTERALRPLIGDDPRHLYIRSQTVGASTARNIAAAHAQGDILAFTDDDCVVSPDWLTRIAHHFQTHPHVGLICGDVRLAPHDKSQGIIPEYVAVPGRQTSTPLLKWRERGILANMALRRDVFMRVGPFDEALGPGSVFYLGEDDDMTYRVLRAGYTVLSSADAYVTHWGFRDWSQACDLMRRAGVGLAAAYMKRLRMGDVAVIPTLLFEWVRCVNLPRLLLLRRHCGARYALGYAQGMLGSFRLPLHRALGVYLPPPVNSVVETVAGEPLNPYQRPHPADISVTSEMSTIL